MHNIHIAAKALLLSVVAAAVGILIAAMLTFAANNASIAQAERPYPPEPFALPATLITATPEQWPAPQQPESTECVRERGKEYAKDLRNGWKCIPTQCRLSERPNKRGA